MIQFYWMKCSAKPSTSITKCNKRLYSIKNVDEEEKNNFNNHNLCKTHYKMFKKNGSIQLWNGSYMSFDKKTNNIILSNNIELYRKLYLLSLNTSTFCKDKMKDNLSIISNGSMTNVIDKLCEIGAFTSRKEIFNFFRIAPKRDLNHKLRFFYGIYYYYSINIEKVIFLQRIIRQKIYFLKHKESIIKVQRFVKHKKWLQSLPVKPERMRKVFMKNETLIIKIQRYIKKRISNIISHECPYTLEKFINIPKKYRIPYKEIINNTTHYFFFHIKWLHKDWMSQIEKKTFVINPLTKKEFPNTFIEEVSKRIWRLTRIDNDYCIDESCNKTHKYDIKQDWDNEFIIRSSYSKYMMILDLSKILDISIPNIISFYESIKKIQYINFFMNVFPELSSILFDTSYINLYDILHKDMIFISKSIFRKEDDNILYGLYIYYILSSLYNVYLIVKEEDIYYFIKTLFKDNFIKCFM